jgi:hypothetical protein
MRGDECGLPGNWGFLDMALTLPPPFTLLVPGVPQGSDRARALHGEARVLRSGGGARPRHGVCSTQGRGEQVRGGEQVRQEREG